VVVVVVHHSIEHIFYLLPKLKSTTTMNIIKVCCHVPLLCCLLATKS